MRIAFARIEAGVHVLTPPERELIARAVDSRRHEFATGRQLARGLLREFGIADFDLLRDADRVPSWPPAFVGSISHTKDLCAVAVAQAAHYRGIGIDLEPDEPVGEGLEDRICTPIERARFEGASRDERGRSCRTIFSIKEAVYKAFFPELREFWGFQDVEVEVDLAAGRFLAKTPPSTGRSSWEGRVFRREGWLISGIAIRQA